MTTRAGRIRHLLGTGLVASGVIAAAIGLGQSGVGATSETCSDLLGPGYQELKIEWPIGDQTTFTDGTLEVTLSDFVTKPGEPNEDLGFHWESNIGVDGVYLKAASDKQGASVLFQYDEATSGDVMTGEVDETMHAISHASFCYDTGGTTTSAPTTTSTVPETTTTVPGTTTTVAPQTTVPTIPTTTVAPTAPIVVTTVGPGELPYTGNDTNEPLAIAGLVLVSLGLALLLFEHEVLRERRS